ncbi:MAG: sugar ABC transporter substrate-binding protein, partial [Candidatus Caldatribacteriaceae bacterium]
MEKKGKVLVVVLLVVMLVGLWGGLVFAQEGKKLVFGYIAYSRKDVWNNYSILAFEYAAKKKGIETIVLDPEGNLEKAVAAMEDLIAKKVDGISVFTITPELDVTLYEMAKKAGIPITFENSLPADTSLDYIS